MSGAPRESIGTKILLARQLRQRTYILHKYASASVKNKKVAIELARLRRSLRRPRLVADGRRRRHGDADTRKLFCFVVIYRR